MIKIFFNNKILLFNDKISPILKGANVLFLNENTTSAINLFFNNDDATNLEILNCPEVQAFEEIKKFVKIIPAAGGKVLDHSGNILFIKRFGKWDLPKGWQEKGESLEECAIREVAEECGISMEKLNISHFITTTYHVYKQNGELLLKQTSWYEMQYFDNEKFVPQNEEDITEVCWIPPEKLDIIKENTYENIKIVIAVR